MKTLLAAIAGALMLAGFGTSAKADVLFQSVDNLAARPDLIAMCSSCNGRFQAYSGVRLDTDAYVTNIDLVSRAFPGACCFYHDLLYVRVYDGAPDDQSAPLIYERHISPLNSSRPADERLTSATLTEWESAIISFQTPDLLLRANRDYSFSFVENTFHLPVFRTGYSPLYQDEGPGYGFGFRDKFTYHLSNGSQNRDGAVGFRLNGIATSVPEPGSWALLILGFGAAGAGLRRRGALRQAKPSLA